MAKTRTIMACRDCRQQVSQWAGRCPGCGAWGTIEEVAGASRDGHSSTPVPLRREAGMSVDARVTTGLGDLDRVLGGGLVPGSVTLLAGEPGIGKSTLLLQLLAGVASDGHPCLLVSGEESHAQVAGRTRRLDIDGDQISFAPGRDLAAVLSTATEARPFLLAVDSIQALRDTSGSQVPGGVSQVRTCADALVGLAKTLDIAVVMTGHVTKDGDLAGPRALEHAVDVVLSFDGDARSGLRVISGGKNRFGAEGESAWFEMGAGGLAPIDPTAILVSSQQVPGAAVGVPLAAEPSRSRCRPWSAAPRARPGARPPVSTPDGSSWSRPCSTVPPGSGSDAPSSSVRRPAASGSTIPRATSPWRPRWHRHRAARVPPKGRSSSGRSPSRARCAPWSACVSGSPQPGRRGAPTCSRHPATKHPTVSRSCRSARLPRP